MAASHLGSSIYFPVITITEYTMHISRLIKIAEMPSVIMISLK